MKKKLFGIALFLLLAGCSLWGDFTTYFNTYYNASLAFEQAQKEMAKTKKELFQFKQPRISSSAKKLLDEVIKKCSAILQFHAKSSYFDDALLMIGKSFYYEQSYSKALRKFNELATLKSSELALENELWIGKTKLHLRQYDAGMKLLEDVKTKALKEENLKIAEEALIEEIRYLLYSENTDLAINKIKELLSVSESEELKAEITYDLGKLYEKNGDRKAAMKTFAEVMKYEPTYDIEFNSRLEYARLKKENGEIEESLKLLTDMENENKFSDMLDKVNLEIADIYYKQGKIEDAVSIYQDVDTTYKRTESSGIAAFNLGQIMEKDYNDYDSAMYYYDRCLAAKTPGDMKLEARQRNKLLGNYLTLHEKLAKQEKQLKYLTEPESFVRDSLLYEEYKRKQDSIRAAQKKMVGRRRYGRTNYGAQSKQKDKIISKPIRPRISADSLRSLISDTEFEMGNLFFGDLNVLDSAYYYYNNSLKNKPNSPNKPKILYAMGNYYLMLGDSARADSLFNYIYENYKYDKIVNEAAKKIGKPPIDFESDPAEKIYRQGEDKYLAKDYEEALKIFLGIPKRYPNSPYAPQAYYTAGFILENDLYMPDSAASLYDSLVTKYRATPYTKEVRPKLNYYKRIQKAILDSIKRARQDSLNSLSADSVKFSKTVSDSLSRGNISPRPKTKRNAGREGNKTKKTSNNENKNSKDSVYKNLPPGVLKNKIKPH